MSKNINKNRLLSGERNENEIVTILQRYTDCIYKNIYLPTIFTKRGITEVDILFYFKNTIFVIETKNIIELEGKIDNYNWIMKSKSGEYKNYNPIVQNKLHVRVFKNRFFERFGYFPKVISFVVVPDGVVYEDTIKNEVITMQELNDILQCYHNNTYSHLKYQFISFMEEV